MPYHIKKSFALDANKTVYYKGTNVWTDKYSDRKQYSNKSDADAQVANPDGKNGGFTNSTVVTE
jgi:hypothetical protein